MADKKDPIGSVTKKKPAVVEILDPKKGDLYKAMDTSDENLRKSSEYKLAMWTESIEEARDQAKLMNLRRATGRPKVSKDPENPQSGREWAMPKHEEPGTPVKQNHDYKIPKPKLDAYSKGQKTRFLIAVNAKRVNPRPENKLKMAIYRMPITAVDSLVCMCLARNANKELAGQFFPNLEAASGGRGPKTSAEAAEAISKNIGGSVEGEIITLYVHNSETGSDDPTNIEVEVTDNGASVCVHFDSPDGARQDLTFDNTPSGLKSAGDAISDELSGGGILGAPKKGKAPAKKKEKKSPKETAPAPEAATPAAPEEASEAFSQRAKRALATALGLSMEEMPDPDGKGSHLPDEDWVGSGEVASWGGLTQDAGPRDYVVYDSMETAEDVAKAAVLNDLQDQPELFNQEWLLSQIPDDDIESHMADIIRESYESYFSDIEESEPERFKEELERLGVDTAEEAVEQMVSDSLGNDNGVGWYVGDFGQEAFDEEMKNNLLPYLGTDALRQIAARAVNEDGAGHFISGWDGELNELEGGMVYAMW